MTIVCGVDGCKGGWIAITKNLDTGEIAWYLRKDASELFFSDPVPDIFAVDIPIGLLEKGTRACDPLARKLLSPKRGSSVFPAPLRPLLEASSYQEACDIRFDIEGKKISRQTWAIVPKIRDVDMVLRDHVDLQLRVHEIHPEVCFYSLAGGHPMRFNKKKPEGQQERIALLEPLFGDVIYDLLKQKRTLQSSADDILDAFTALWTAECIAKGTAFTLPNRPPLDKYGLKMQMVTGNLNHSQVKLGYHVATQADLDLLSVWNHQLIHDEGHRNPMTVIELRKRMQDWLQGDYTAVIFTREDQPVAYALYIEYPDKIYLRQLFVHGDYRRQGIGREAVISLHNEIWPPDKRLTVEVLTANTGAVSFWRAMGYQIIRLNLKFCRIK